MAKKKDGYEIYNGPPLSVMVNLTNCDIAMLQASRRWAAALKGLDNGDFTVCPGMPVAADLADVKLVTGITQLITPRFPKCTVVGYNRKGIKTNPGCAVAMEWKHRGAFFALPLDVGPDLRNSQSWGPCLSMLHFLRLERKELEKLKDMLLTADNIELAAAFADAAERIPRPRASKSEV